MAEKASGPMCCIAPFWNKKAMPQRKVQSSSVAAARGRDTGSLEFGVERGDQALDFCGRRVVDEGHAQDSALRIEPKPLQAAVAVEIAGADADVALAEGFGERTRIPVVMDRDGRRALFRIGWTEQSNAVLAAKV